MVMGMIFSSDTGSSNCFVCRLFVCLLSCLLGKLRPGFYEILGTDSLRSRAEKLRKIKLNLKLRKIRVS